MLCKHRGQVPAKREMGNTGIGSGTCLWRMWVAVNSKTSFCKSKAVAHKAPEWWVPMSCARSRILGRGNLGVGLEKLFTQRRSAIKETLSLFFEGYLVLQF